MSRADMTNRASRLGVSYGVHDCAPIGVDHPVEMIFDDMGDEIKISIVETKRGGRTYKTQAVIEKQHLKQIMEGLS